MENIISMEVKMDIRIIGICLIAGAFISLGGYLYWRNIGLESKLAEAQALMVASDVKMSNLLSQVDALLNSVEFEKQQRINLQKAYEQQDRATAEQEDDLSELDRILLDYGIPLTTEEEPDDPFVTEQEKQIMDFINKQLSNTK